MKTIDLSLTWEAALKICLITLENGDEIGKKIAREELKKMAMAADKWNEHVASKK